MPEEADHRPDWSEEDFAGSAARDAWLQKKITASAAVADARNIVSDEVVRAWIEHRQR